MISSKQRSRIQDVSTAWHMVCQKEFVNDELADLHHQVLVIGAVARMYPPFLLALVGGANKLVALRFLDKS